MYYNFIFLNFNLCYLLNIFNKRDFMLEMFVADCRSYCKWCLSIVRSTGPQVGHYVEMVHVAMKKQGGQLEPTYSSSVRIRGVALGTYWKQ